MRKETRRYTSARERAEKQKSGFTSMALKVPDGVQMFQPKAGRYLIDIIPFVAGEGNPWADEGCLHWERTYYAHRSIGANGDTYVCPRVTAKERCPVCEHRMKMMKEGDEDNEQLIKDLSPKQRQLFQIINLKDPDKGVQLWDISYHLFGKMLDARLRNSEEEDQWENFFHLEDGLTLKVAFAEKTFGGFAYVEVESIDFRPRRRPYDDDMLDEGHCLDELLMVPEYDDLKKAFLETGKEEDDDDAPPKKKKAQEEDDEDEPPKKKHRDEEDDEDEPPKKKHRDEEDDFDEPPKKKKAPADDDDWDDFDEPPKKKKAQEEDDEDEPPKKKKAQEEDDDDWDDLDEPPKKKKREEDDDDEPPKKKHRDEEDDDDDPPRVHAGPRKRDEDDEDEAPKKKRHSDED